MFLCCQFMGDFQIGDNGKGRNRVGVDGTRSGCNSSSSNRGVAEGRRRRTEGTIGHGACSQLARFEVRGFKTKKKERGTEKEEREKGSKKTRSVYTKKCSASDSRTG